MTVSGLHHITATCGDAEQCRTFVTDGLGLRLVKKTVNFDDPSYFHFYFGDIQGNPGTLVTLLPRADTAQGRIGSGQATITSFSVPEGSLSYWSSRLRAAGASPIVNETVWGEKRSIVQSPTGILLALVESEDNRKAYVNGHVHDDVAVRGICGVTLAQQSTAHLPDILTGVLGFQEIGMERIGSAVHCRFQLSQGDRNTNLDVQIDAGIQRGRDGIGTVHHIAFAVGNEESLISKRNQLTEIGLQPTEVIDRTYFKSVYARTPGGILIELATNGPGFAVDEPHDLLGQKLCLPQHLEPRRTEIEQQLPSLSACSSGA